MGMVDGCGHGGQQKYTINFVMFVGRDSKHTGSVFAKFNRFIALTAHSDA